VQHQLRAHTPNDAKALRATVDTYPVSGYADLGEVITMLGIGEAVVTVMSERGAPTPVAWTKLRAPESRMGPADPEAVAATLGGSPLQGKYSQRVDRESAREMLAARLEEGAAKARAEQEAADRVEAEPERTDGVDYPKESKKPSKPSTKSRSKSENVIVEALQSSAGKQLMRTAAREIARGLFRVGRR
jgi:hypothetical protein